MTAATRTRTAGKHARTKMLLSPDVQVGDLVTLAGPITQGSVKRLARLLENTEGPLTIVISSQGGDIDAAMALHEMIRLQVESGRTIVTAGFGAVMSAAVLILAAGTKGSRYLSRFSRLMYHESATGMEGPLSHLRQQVNALEDYDRDFDAIIASYTGKTVAKVRKLYKGGDKWMSAQEAVDFGFVDKLL